MSCDTQCYVFSCAEMEVKVNVKPLLRHTACFIDVISFLSDIGEGCSKVGKVRVTLLFCPILLLKSTQIRMRFLF